MADFEIVDGDAQPALSVTLTAEDGNPQNLSAANSVDRVELRMCREGQTLTFVGVITDDLAGKVRVDFPAEGIDKGTYTGEWVVVFDDDTTKTFQKNSAGKPYTIIVPRRRC